MWRPKSLYLNVARWEGLGDEDEDEDDDDDDDDD